TETRPSVTFSFWTERLGGTALPEGSEVLGALSDFPPRLEKFHLPEGVCRRVISGRSRVSAVTCSALEKISGMTSTPTFNDFARIKGDWLKLGSSAMDRSSALTLPERIDKPRLPIL